MPGRETAGSGTSSAARSRKQVFLDGKAAIYPIALRLAKGRKTRFRYSWKIRDYAAVEEEDDCLQPSPPWSRDGVAESFPFRAITRRDGGLWISGAQSR